jgi:hypothetical protein
MARVTWTPDARAQLDEIFDFIAVKNRNLAAAEKLLRAIADRARFFPDNRVAALLGLILQRAFDVFRSAIMLPSIGSYTVGLKCWS